MTHSYPFARPALTVDIVVFALDDEDLQVMLIERDLEPFAGQWALPGGFVRVEETLEIVRDRLGKSGFGAAVGKRVVLTGGASQLQGLPEAARRILGRNVRIGRPLGVAGLPEAAKGPAFAAAVGLMIYPQVAGFESREGRLASRLRMTGTGGRFNRMSQWIRDSF